MPCAACADRRHPRTLLYASGLRVSELVNVTLDRLDFDNRIIRVTGKGDKTRLVPVGENAPAKRSSPCI